MLDAIQGDESSRSATLTEAEQTLLNDAYVMPLYREVITTTSDTAKVSGWSVLPNGTYWFGGATLG